MSGVCLGRPFAIGRGPWRTPDPFLFCVFHDDQFPKAAGGGGLGPERGELRGRDLGMDFSYRNGWSMYHGETVPGFPQHPHWGFETVTAVMQGLVDHFDSLGATGRYGNGDVQWMTAGNGVQHSEIFPLVNEAEKNPLELFQIWVNLPAKKKASPPYFEMHWKPQIPRVSVGDAEVIVVAGGAAFNVTAGTPPPDSWAADPQNDVAIWIVNGKKKGGAVTLPPAVHGKAINRTVYFFRGDASGVRVSGGDGGGGAVPITRGTGVEVDASQPLTLAASGDGIADFLVLQGRPVAERVVQQGPFVCSSQDELARVVSQYHRTQFGGWPWPSPEHHHPRGQARFARRPGAKADEYPPA